MAKEKKPIINNSGVDIYRSQSSVNISRGAKGNIAFDIKVYADSVEEAEKLALESYDRLSTHFPATNQE